MPRGPKGEKREGIAPPSSSRRRPSSQMGEQPGGRMRAEDLPPSNRWRTSSVTHKKAHGVRITGEKQGRSNLPFVAVATGKRVSPDFTGYWQRHAAG
jgi:hypothetical protein